MDDNPIIVVERPHQGSPIAWVAYGWKHAAKLAGGKGIGPSVQSYFRGEIEDIFGDEIPEDIKEILDSHESVVGITGHEGMSFVSPSEAPTLEEVVKAWIADDLSSADFLTSPEEVKEYLERDHGHNWAESVSAVTVCKKRLGW